MTTVRQLYELQELDLEVENCRSQIARIDGQMGSDSKIETLQSEVQHLRGDLQHLLPTQKDQELDVQSHREKLRQVEAKLYSGTVTNPRELENLTKEAASLRSQLQLLENTLLETMLSQDQGEVKLKETEGALRSTRERWQVAQQELAQEKERVSRNLDRLSLSRQGLSSHLDPREIKRYEELRASKGGRAVAKVERGLCVGCRMALPTHLLQRARAGRETVFCASCGRILLVG